MAGKHHGNMSLEDHGLQGKGGT